MSERKTGERRLLAHDHELQALALRKAGASFDQIAEAVGYRGRSGAYKAVTTALRETLREPADEVRALELERLDVMLMAVWPRAQRGDILAQQQVLRLMERRARYLGLDAPARVDVDISIRAMAEKLAAEEGLDPAELIAEAERITALVRRG